MTDSQFLEWMTWQEELPNPGFAAPVLSDNQFKVWLTWQKSRDPSAVDIATWSQPTTLQSTQPSSREDDRAHDKLHLMSLPQKPLVDQDAGIIYEGLGLYRRLEERFRNKDRTLDLDFNNSQVQMVLDTTSMNNPATCKLCKGCISRDF